MANNSPSIVTPLHLHRLQLFGICSIGQYALQQLLMDYSLAAHPSLPNAFEALSLILTNNKDKVKKFTSIFTTPTVRDVIYQDVSNDIFHPSILIDRLDVNSLMEILRGIKDFPSASPCHHAGWTCKNLANHMSKCCLDCDHKCPICVRDQCKKKCCITGKNCSHRCKNCNIAVYDCVENKYVCCKSCMTCLNCTLLKHGGLSSWERLFKKCISPGLTGICQTLQLRLSLKIITIFRNITMHLTDAECDEMDRGSFNDPKVPSSFCNSWVTIRDTFWFAVKFLLNYSHKNGTLSLVELNSHLESLRTICTTANVSEMMVYQNSIRKFIQVEGLVNANKMLRDVEKRLDTGLDDIEKVLKKMKKN